MVLTTLAYSNSMTDTILGRMSPVEEAVEILTSNLGIVLKKEAGSTMNHTTANGILNASIVLPQLDALNLDNNLIVNSVVSCDQLCAQELIISFKFSFQFLFWPHFF